MITSLSSLIPLLQISTLKSLLLLLLGTLSPLYPMRLAGPPLRREPWLFPKFFFLNGTHPSAFFAWIRSRFPLLYSRNCFDILLIYSMRLILFFYLLLNQNDVVWLLSVAIGWNFTFFRVLFWFIFSFLQLLLYFRTLPFVFSIFFIINRVSVASVFHLWHLNFYFLNNSLCWSFFGSYK